MRPKRQRFLQLKFDRILAHDLLQQTGVLACCFVIALVISYSLLSFVSDDWSTFCNDHNLSFWLLPIYLLIDTNALNNLYIDNDVHGWMLFASSVTFLLGAFIFNGMIIGIITNAIEARVKSYEEGRIHYLQSGHHIIMGYDDIVPSIILHIFKTDDDAKVLILTSAKTKEVREKLMKSLGEAQMENVILNYGHRTSEESFKDICLEAAEQIYIVGNHTRSEHDAINVECVDSIYRYLSKQKDKQHPGRITCVFNDLDTYAAFKTSEIFRKVNDLGIEFIPYNVCAGWAKQVFVKRKHVDRDNPDREFPYPAVYKGCVGPEDKKYIHLVFVGTTNYSVAFAMEAAHVLHFPNFNQDRTLKTLITFIDVNADKEKDEFITRNRHFFEVQSYYYEDLLGDSGIHSYPDSSASVFNTRNKYKEGIDFDFLDVQFEFIKGDIFSMRVQERIREWANDTECQRLSIFLAMAEQRRNFVMAMNMPDEVYDNEVPIFIRQDRSDNFVTNLREADEAIRKDEKKNKLYYVKEKKLKSTDPLGGRYSNIYPFGMNESAYSADENSLRRAKLINYLYATANYDAYKFTGLLTLSAMSDDEIWKVADEKWKELTVALKWSNLYAAYAVRSKLATLRVHRGLDIDDESRDTWSLSDEETEMLAEVEHNRWNVEKLLMGFRKPRREEDKYVDENKPFAKELEQNKKRFIHHDIRPFKKLDDVKKLDYEFSRYIPWIMKMTEERK